MNRLITLAAACALLSIGCTHDGELSMKKALGWDEPSNRAAMPNNTKNLPLPDIKVAARVEETGRKIIAQNTFTGIEPLFMTIGVKESVIFHRGTEQLVISEGLVGKCGSDAELVAVLCSELGQMVAEKRMAVGVGRNVDPIPEATAGGSPLFPGGTAHDAGQQANLAFHEKKYPRGVARPDAVDATNTARELLTGSGYSPAELDRVEPLLKQSKRGEELRKLMAASAPPPEWKK